MQNPEIIFEPLTKDRLLLSLTEKIVLLKLTANWITQTITRD